MTPLLEHQLRDLQNRYKGATATPLPNGAFLIEVPNFPLDPTAWNRSTTSILFFAPPGYPAAPPDCFWAAPSGLRLKGEGTPKNTNDSNPIPGLAPPRPTTWFSWHVQGWDPNSNSLVTYMSVIKTRLSLAQ
jgi:hypothetical protein